MDRLHYNQPHPPEEPPADGPRATGEIRFEGSRLMIAETTWGDEEVCDDTHIYEVHRLANGHIKFVTIDDN